MIVKAVIADATVIPGCRRLPRMLIDHLPKQLEAWHDFYLVVGTGAAALTGLLFVIVSSAMLVPELPMPILGTLLPVVIAMSRAIGLYAIAATMLLLVVVGIRNAWDVVLWVAQQARPEPPEKKPARRR